MSGASEEYVRGLQAEMEQMRLALGSCLWVFNNLHNAGTEAFAEYARAAEKDARAALKLEQGK